MPQAYSTVAMNMSNNSGISAKILPKSMTTAQAPHMKAVANDGGSKYAQMVKNAQQHPMSQLQGSNLNQKVGEMTTNMMSGLKNAANQAVQTVDETLRMVDPALAGPQYQVNIDGTIRAQPNFFDNHFAFKNNGPSGGIRATAPRRAGNTVMMADYTVTLKTPEGDQTITCADDVYIIDAAEEQGVDLPYSCKAGACSTCAAKVISGTVDNSDQSFLDEDQLAQGFILSCVAYPTSDVTLETDKEDDLF